MGRLTQAQWDLLVWIADSSHPVLDAWANDALTLIGGDGENRDINGSDLRDLVDLGLVRKVPPSSYEVTGAGRDVIAAAQNPPRAKNPIGFG